MRKKAILAVLVIILSGTAAAQFVTVDNVELDIEESATVEDGADFTIEVDGSGLTEARLYYDSSGNGFFTLYDTYECSGSSCTINENFDYGNEGDLDVQAEGYADDINKGSDIRTVSFSSSERERYVEFTEFPSSWTVGESGEINAMAYDEDANLPGQNFRMQVREREGGQWGSWSTISSEHCEWDQITQGQYCYVGAEFTPDSSNEHEVSAFVRTSDDNVQIISRRTFTPEGSSELVLNSVSTSTQQVEPSESTTLEAEVENSGSESAFASVRWYADDNSIGHSSISVPGDSSRTLSVDRSYSQLMNRGLETGRSYELSAEEQTDGDTLDSGQTITLLEEEDDPAEFEVTIDSADDITEGEVLEVDYTINNVGDQQGTEDVNLFVENDLKDTDSDQTLGAGASSSGTLTWDTEVGDRGWYTIRVEAGEGEDEDTVNVARAEDPDEGEVTLNSVSASRYNVDPGQSTTLRANVENTRDSSSFVQTYWRADGQRLGWSSITVPSNTERQLTVDRTYNQLVNRGLEAGECYSLDGRMVFDGEESFEDAPRDLCLGEEEDDSPARFEITSIDSNSPVTEGETVEVDFTVENTGGRSDTQDLELFVESDGPVDTRRLSLDEGESRDRTLRWDTQTSDAGWKTLYVNTDNDEKSTIVNVKSREDDPEPGLELRSVTASRYSVGPGESTTLRSRVENNRDQASFVQVSWRADNLDLGSSTQNIPRNTERTLERERSYSQLINRGLKSGECYSLSGRLRFSGDLIDSRDATQSICLEEDDDDRDPDPGSYDLDVIVLSSSGSPLADAEVSAGGQTAFTRSNGVATIEGLEQGSYDVTASKPGYSTRVRNNVQMDRDRTISLTLDEVDGVEADFSFSPDRPLEGQSVSFNGGLSSGNIVSYEWSFDDGSTASGRTVTHTFDEPGFYRVNLEVEDSQGRTDDRTRVVQVRSEADDPEFFDLDVEVVDSETGDEIRDARVSVDGRTRTTDSRGRVNFNLEESVYSVFVSADNYRSSSRTVTLNRDRDIQVELDPREDTVDRGNIRINDVRMPASVCRGDDVTARLDLENTGDRDRAFTLSASGLSNQIDRSYSLQDGESFTRSVEFINVEGSGNERVSFSTGDDSRERTVQVRDCPETEEGDISISARPTQIRIGESVRVSGYVDNVRRGTQVTIGSDNRQSSLGSTTTDPDGRYELYVEPSRIGEQTLTAEASGREASTRIDVLPTVSVISASSRPDRVFEGESYEVCGEIESQSSGPLVVLKQDGETVDSKYGRGEVCFERRSSPGNYNYEVQAWARGQSSSQSTSVEVLEMDSEVRNFPDQITSVRSGSGMIQVDLYNNQREFREYQLELDGIPRDWISQSRKEVMLDTGERSTQYFYITPKEEGTFHPTLTVRSGGEVVYSEEIRVRSGGTDREPSRWDRFIMWLRYR